MYFSCRKFDYVPSLFNNEGRFLPKAIPFLKILQKTTPCTHSNLQKGQMIEIFTMNAIQLLFT